MLLKNECTIELLAKGRYGGIGELRNLILNLYNPKVFTDVNCQRLTRCLDREHNELFHDIIQYAESEEGYVYIVHTVAPIILRDMKR